MIGWCVGGGGNAHHYLCAAKNVALVAPTVFTDCVYPSVSMEIETKI